MTRWWDARPSPCAAAVLTRCMIAGSGCNGNAGAVSRASVFRLAFALVLLTACVTPHVLSPYGDLCGVNRTAPNHCRPRDKPHDAVDFGPASVGDDVIASADGLVTRVSEYPDAGMEVVIVHDEAPLDRDSRGAHYRTGYLHLRSAAVKPGDRVGRGQVIGEVGLFQNSGLIPHVHWRLWRGNESTDPIDPISKTVGCFERGTPYSGSTLELTFPLPC